ncbi:MAG TPA: F0F1 ATP synthase subunit A [Caulobacteraceae bacterium]|jgi:F-type H+-transporting ATPase subunit a|nr:F0F1 ATP synthase subunit A [Caulobacteraceae bacterium]
MAAINPMEQFLVRKVVPLPAVTVPGLGPIDLSINNSIMFMMLAAALMIGFMLLAAKRELIPSRLQASVEIIYNFVDNTFTGAIIGDRGRPFLPFILTLFLFIAFMNYLGMVPLGFTVTSQLAVTVTLAIMTFAIVLVVAFARNGLGFFKLFWPTGMNVFLAAFLCVIELISFLIRPATLALRLFGNMLGGHIVIFVFASFVIGMGAFAMQGGLASLGFLGAGLSFAMVCGLFVLELLVAGLQAFVFAALACIYLAEVVNLDQTHH